MHAFDQGLTRTYVDQSMEDTVARLDQALSVLPVAAKADASQAEVLHAAQRTGDSSVPFLKSGYVWVDGLGMRFDEDGQLAAVEVSAEEAVQ